MFEPVGRRRLFEDVLAQLEKLIAEGRLQPGDRLPAERELSSALQVSRTSLREALRILEAMGIITVRTGVGPAAGSVMNDDIGPAIARLMSLYMAVGHFSLEDLVDLRGLLGRDAAGEAARNRSEERVAAMRELCERLGRAGGDPAEFHAVNASFVVEVARASGNRLFAHLVAATGGPVEKHLERLSVDPSVWEGFTGEARGAVEEVVEAIAAQDAEAARAAFEGWTRTQRGFEGAASA